MIRGAIALVLALAAGGGVRAERYEATWAEDAALVDGEFARWNFGASPFLEAGYMGGIYTEHRAASVVRVDVRQHMGMKVTGAVLRVYKPKDFIQRRPMRVGVYRVTKSWTEGTDVFGSEGVKAKDGVKWEATPLATAVVPDGEGTWIEFRLPAKVVQEWVDRPDRNDGVVLRVDDGEQKEWGDHVYFCSSENYRPLMGPNLVIEGTGGGRGVFTKRAPKRLVVELADEGEVKAWLAKNGRLARFAKELKLEGEGLRVMQMFDTQARERLIVGRYQRPFHEVIGGMQALIDRHDEKGIREELDRLHEYLLKWEYIRETCWYTSGPVADVWSARQINELFGREIFGTMETSAEGKGKEIWKVVPAEKMGEHNRTVMEDLKKRLGLSAEQVAYLTPRIGELETQENRYLGLFREDLAECQRMLKEGRDGPAVFDAVRRLHMHHEKFLYYQSIYNTPRWTLLTEHAPAEALAAWVAEARREHYERALGGANKR